MNIKKQIESNPTIFFLGIMFAGFVAGIGCYRGIIEMAHLEVMSKIEADKLRNQKVVLEEQLRTLKEQNTAHKKTIDRLKDQLHPQEKNINTIKKLQKQLQHINIANNATIQLEEQVKSQKREISDCLTAKESKIAENRILNSQARKLAETISQLKVDLSECYSSKNIKNNVNSLTSKQKNNLESSFSGDFKFEPLSCKQSGSNVYCRIRITNMSPKEKFIIVGGRGYYSTPSFLFDSNGNQFNAKEVVFGTKMGRDEASQSLSPSLPVIAQIKFTNVPPISGNVTVRVGFTPDTFGVTKANVILRNIPLY